MRSGSYKPRRLALVTGYPITDVSHWTVVRAETIGADAKSWLEDSATGGRWLFKANNVHVTSSATWSQREDVAEKVAGELASRAGLPCATIEFARRGTEAGCISLDLKPTTNWELQTGSVVLDGLLDDYIPGYEISNKLRIGHSLVNI